MKYIAAYMLAKLGGKDEPTIEDVKRIIESVGIEFETEKANELISKLSGKNLNEIMDEGKSKLSVILNGQASHELQNQISNENNEEQNNQQEEEETLELGLGNDFEDLFN